MSTVGAAGGLPARAFVGFLSGRHWQQAAGGTGRSVRAHGYVLLETVVATGLLIVGLAVLGAQVQDAHTSVRKMERRMRAMMLTQQHLAELEMGLIELQSVDEIEEGDFGPRHPDYGWRLITEETAIENTYMLQLEILHHLREDEYQEDDFDFDEAETVYTVYVMKAVPQPVHFGEDFGLNEEEMLELSKRLGDLGIPGLDPESFDLSFFQNVDFEELLESAPLLLDALGMDLADLSSMIPPDLLKQIQESGLLDGLSGSELLEGGNEGGER